jgi:ABC-2 type transport system ATP-binding protein
MAQAIILTNLTKRYAGSKTLAVDELSLSIGEGEVFGFLGSNGAGKSTTIRMIMNFLQPTNGNATILGKDSVRDSVELKRHMGYLSGDVALYHRVTGAQMLNYLGKLQGTHDKAYLRTLTQRFEAELHKPISQLSKGNRQKIGIIQAFMHKPDVLVLDEPTSGLDPVMQERFYETIAEAKARGAAIFLSSHSLGEVQRMCDHVAIIRNGKLVRTGTLADFADQTPIFEVTFTGSVPQSLANNKTLEVLETKDRVVTVKPSGNIAEALAALGTYDTIANLQTSQQELEEEFMSYYNDEDKPHA